MGTIIDYGRLETTVWSEAGRQMRGPVAVIEGGIVIVMILQQHSTCSRRPLMRTIDVIGGTDREYRNKAKQERSD